MSDVITTPTITTNCIGNAIVKYISLTLGGPQLTTWTLYVEYLPPTPNTTPTSPAGNATESNISNMKIVLEYRLIGLTGDTT